MADLNPQAPIVDEARIKRVYDELKRLNMDLDPDPLELGPKRMNNKLAKVRNMIKRCVDIELQVAEDLHWFKRTLNRQQGHYELEFQDLIANDPHVRAGRNIQDREAVAKVRLSERYKAIRHLEESVSDLEAMLVVVRTKAKDLRDTQSRLKDQFKICEHELGLGSRWGKHKPTVFDDEPRATAADAHDIDSLLNEVDAAVPETPNHGIEQNVEAAAEALPGTASSDETDSFLDSLNDLGKSEDAAQETPVPLHTQTDGDGVIDSLLDDL